MKTAALTTIIKPDKDAAEIGEFYRKARGSLIESISYAIACGERLKAKKDSLSYGEWLPWLRANADVLGMNVTSTPQRLMKLAADSASTRNLDEAGALAISRQLWGNDDDPDDDRNDLDLDNLLRDEDGHLTPKAREFIREVKAEKTAAKKAIRSEREAALAGKQLALPQKRYGGAPGCRYRGRRLCSLSVGNGADARSSPLGHGEVGLPIQNKLRLGEGPHRNGLLESEPARTVARRHMRQRARTSTGDTMVVHDRSTTQQA
jgi:hypothetical protein